MAGPSSQIVHLKRGDVSFDLAIHQVNTTNLRRMFRVDAENVWLRDRVDSSAFFAEENGSFSLDSIADFTTLDVEGPELRQPGLSSSVTVDSANRSSNQLPVFKSVVGTKKGAIHSIKLMTAEQMVKSGKGKPSFDGVKTMYLEVKADQANLSYVSDFIKRKLGEEYAIVNNEGIELEDSPVTQGLNFWKTPSRKLYAVPLNRKRVQDVLSDSDEDFIPPKQKKRKRKCSETQNDINQTLVNSIGKIQNTLDEMMAVTKDSKLPLGLKTVLKDCLKCSICTGFMKPPVIAMKCCKTLLGCEPCANSWFSGEDALTKTCPKCRSARGYTETMILRGLDSLLETVRKIEGDEEA